MTNKEIADNLNECFNECREYLADAMKNCRRLQDRESENKILWILQGIDAVQERLSNFNEEEAGKWTQPEVKKKKSVVL